MDQGVASNKERFLDIKAISDGRVSHLNRNCVYYAHLSIYDFAAPFCQDALVLDAGSGAGYGSTYLAEAGAQHVWGIDISDYATEFSQVHFQRPNLTFQTMDLEQIQGFPPQHFDFIYSSNALEHVPNVLNFLRAAWGLLKPTGTLLIAVPPITDERLEYLNIINQYHVNIWTPYQWAHTLGLFFEEIESFLHGVERAGEDFKPEHFTADSKLTEKDFVFEKGTVDDMYQQFTLTAIFVAHKPRSETQIPEVDAPLEFVDGSFTRPCGYIDPTVRKRLKRYFDLSTVPYTVPAKINGEKLGLRQKIGSALALVLKRFRLGK